MGLIHIGIVFVVCICVLCVIGSHYIVEYVNTIDCDTLEAGWYYNICLDMQDHPMGNVILISIFFIVLFFIIILIIILIYLDQKSVYH